MGRFPSISWLRPVVCLTSSAVPCMELQLNTSCSVRQPLIPHIKFIKCNKAKMSELISTERLRCFFSLWNKHCAEFSSALAAKKQCQRHLMFHHGRFEWSFQNSCVIHRNKSMALKAMFIPQTVMNMLWSCIVCSWVFKQTLFKSKYYCAIFIPTIAAEWCCTEVYIYPS